MSANNISINGPQALILSPQAIVAIVNALAEKPYKDVSGPMNEIISQLKKQEPDVPVAPLPM